MQPTILRFTNRETAVCFRNGTWQCAQRKTAFLRLIFFSGFLFPALAAGSFDAYARYSCSSPGFAPAIVYSSGGNDPYGITVGDFNSERNITLTVTNRNSGTIGVLLESGSGSVAFAATFACRT